MEIDVKIVDREMTYMPFTFQGFWSEGRCHLRVYAKKTGIIFICSQLPNYHGTSVTNAVERIRMRAIEQVYRDGIVAVSLKKGLLDHFRSKTKEAALVRSAVIDHINENSVWVEHYPPEVGLSEGRSYSIVHFSESGEPGWSYVTLERLEERFAGVNFILRREELEQ